MQPAEANLQLNMWWIRDPSNPVLSPLADRADECGCCMNPNVVRMGDEYHLYYAGGDAAGHRRICLATAPVRDPHAWTRLGVVLDLGEPGAFDANWVVLPHLVRFPDRWHLYYTGNSGQGTGLSAFPGIGLAFSDNGRHFTRYEGNPVIARSGVEGDPDCQGVAGGSVINLRRPDGPSEWRFYYTGCPTLGDDLFLNQQKTVCYARSDDGIRWEKKGALLFRDPGRDYLNVAAAGPVVWQETNGLFRMLYSAIGTRWGYYSICYAESDDGITWRRGDHYGDDLVLGPTGDNWERQMVEYPSAVREEGRWRLFYCGNGYGRTGIGTAVSGSLRAQATVGLCRLRLVAPGSGSSWSYRVPEGLSCDEGVFKSHGHPVVDWQGPNGDGMLWHEWASNDEDFRVQTEDLRARRLGLHFIQGIEYRVLVWPAPHGLELKFTATNVGDRTWHNVVGVPCLGTPSGDFRDDLLERTWVGTVNNLTLLKDTDRGTGDPRRTHYLVRGQNPIRFAAPSFWGDLSQTRLGGGAILRTNVDGRLTVGTAWETVAEVWDNQDQHGCIHSNFSLGDLAPGQTKSVKGRITLVEGSPSEALIQLQF